MCSLSLIVFQFSFTFHCLSFCLFRIYVLIGACDMYDMTLAIYKCVCARVFAYTLYCISLVLCSDECYLKCKMHFCHLLIHRIVSGIIKLVMYLGWLSRCVVSFTMQTVRGMTIRMDRPCFRSATFLVRVSRSVANINELILQRFFFTSYHRLMTVCTKRRNQMFAGRMWS